MKKIISITLVLLLILSCTACGAEKTERNNKSSKRNRTKLELQTAIPKTVGIQHDGDFNNEMVELPFSYNSKDKTLTIKNLADVDQELGFDGEFLYTTWLLNSMSQNNRNAVLLLLYNAELLPFYFALSEIVSSGKVNVVRFGEYGVSYRFFRNNKGQVTSSTCNLGGGERVEIQFSYNSDESLHCIKVLSDSVYNKSERDVDWFAFEYNNQGLSSLRYYRSSGPDDEHQEILSDTEEDTTWHRCQLDSNGNVIRTIDSKGNGESVTFLYQDNMLVGISEKSGKYSIAYEDGKMVSVTQAEGKRIRVEFKY